jgi:GWxTD domain-containing protein
MKCVNKGFTVRLIFFSLFFFSAAGCASRINIKQDPFYETFFEKTSLIMTKQEIEIYKHLPNKESKQEFIEEFWKIRDPDPSTDENEAKTEFEQRVEYANKWFTNWEPNIGKDIREDKKSEQGWDSDRGRIYIILGPPDSVVFDGTDIRFDQSRERASARQWTQEVWYYNRYRLWIEFQKTGVTTWTMNADFAELNTALESAKLNWISSPNIEEAKRSLKFKAEFKNDRIIIKIPVSRISYEEKEQKLNSEFRIKVSVYLNNKKIDEIEEKKFLSESQEELLAKKNVIFELPYKPKLKGRYFFDIVVEDLKSLSVSKYRGFAKYKLTK